MVKIAKKFLNFKFLKESTWFKKPSHKSKLIFKSTLQNFAQIHEKLQQKISNKSHVLNNIQMIQKSKRNLEFIQMSHKLKMGHKHSKISLSKIPLRVQIKLSRIKSFFADKNSLKNEISIFCYFFARSSGNIKIMTQNFQMFSH